MHRIFSLAIALLVFCPLAAVAADGPRPNILWLTCEDMSPTLGCYGDRYATSPHVDRLAREGLRFTQAFAMASVCTPARSCLITGVYPTTLGSQHLRAAIRRPDAVKCFTEYLRQAGYYCTNNVKTDYNFPVPKEAWDECSAKAHWRGRKPGQPFFSVFNCMHTHQSRLRFPPKQLAEITRDMKPEEFHDPARVPLPPYYPDTAAIRRELARNYDLITAMDQWVGGLLAELQADGLADDTIVFFYSDHGTGMPRHKRALYDSGLHVPLVVRSPKKLQGLCAAAPGETTDRLVSFVDFAPTVLSLAGIAKPDYIYGRAFLGPKAEPERQYMFAVRDRVDEVFETSRAVRDHRYKYIRNFMPHRPYMGLSAFSEPAESVRAWRALAAANELRGPASRYLAETKPIEELYDLASDPFEINNLATDAKHEPTLVRMRTALLQWMVDTRDTGLLPEAEMFRRAAGKTIYELTPSQFPVKRILDAADLVGRPAGAPQRLAALLADEDAAVRYWAAVGLMAPGVDAQPAAEALSKALHDAAPDVRLAAAEALARLGRQKDALPVIVAALDDADPCVRLHAVAVLVAIGEKARPALNAVRTLRAREAQGDHADFARWAAGHVLRRFGDAVRPDFE